MEKGKFKGFIFFVTILCSLVLFSTNVFANSTSSTYFEFDKSTGTITGYDQNAPKNVVIPSKINGVGVKNIGDEAFKSMELLSVELPNTLKKIGKDAFWDNDLNDIKIPASVTHIDRYAFSQSTNENAKVDLYLSDNIVYLGECAFSSANISSTNIPNSISKISNYLFFGNHLTSIEIPDNITEIGGCSLRGNNLKTVKIPDSVKTIGYFAFYGNNLTNVAMGDGVKHIDANAFDNNAIVSVNFPNSLEQIGWEAFKNNNLTSVIVPNSLKEITMYDIKTDLYDVPKEASIYNLENYVFDSTVDVSYRNVTSNDSNNSNNSNNTITYSGINVVVDGNSIDFSKYGANPYIHNGTTMLPFRSIFEQFDGVINTDNYSSNKIIKYTLHKSNGRIELELLQNENVINVTNITENQEDSKGRYDVKVTWTIYDTPIENVNGRVYIPVRAVAEACGYDVAWNGVNKTVYVDTSIQFIQAPYNAVYTRIDKGNDTNSNNNENINIPDKETSKEPENNVTTIDINKTHINSISNYGGVSSVQQFAYKNNGIAYGYLNSANDLVITTSNDEIVIDGKYPKLGDIIADEDGNFYVVWGKEGVKNSDETLFISKYNAKGSHLKTTGFKGESLMGEDGNTKIPFDAGGCNSAISDGVLMVTYAREMYNKHQSNNVIGVNIDDMSPIKWGSKWDIPYNSHSFNQKVVWSNKINEFVYADLGDAYDRGFVITTDKLNDVIFDFYLPANSNYNMRIVNKTNAQLGDLLEVDENIVLVGSSSKSISEAANSEKQNLFIQIFDPSKSKVSQSMFVGGTTRKGATSMDINDNSNTPLTSVTNYGVHWLTNYTDGDVVAPQAVVCDDKIAILWSKSGDDSTYYMVVSNKGEVITKETKLDKKLNSYEQPIYYNGSIYWVSVYDKELTVNSLDM